MGLGFRRRSRHRTTYEHSGELGTSLVVTPAVGLAFAFVLSMVYAYLVVYSPLKGLLVLFFALVYGILLGSAIAKVAHDHKCRNPRFILAVGGASALVGFYFAWVWFVYALVKRYDDSPQAAELSFFQVATSLGDLWATIREINRTGWGDDDTAGFLRWIGWLIEAGILLGLPVLASFQKIDGAHFCEDCDVWCDGDVTGLDFWIPRGIRKASEFDFTDIAKLEQLERAPASACPRVRVDVDYCPGCGSVVMFGVLLVREEEDEDGDINRVSHPITPKLYPDHVDVARMLALANRPIVERRES